MKSADGRGKDQGPRVAALVARRPVLGLWHGAVWLWLAAAPALAQLSGVAASSGGSGGYGGNGGAGFWSIARVEVAPGFAGRGIPHVTVPTPTQYRSTMARQFFVSGGVNLGNAPAVAPPVRPGNNAGYVASRRPAGPRWMLRPRNMVVLR